MKKPKRKTITELRNSLFETFDEVIAGQTQIITHKNGQMVAMMAIDKIEDLYEEIEIHKNLAIGFAQAMRGEGITTSELMKELKTKEKNLRLKYD
jgi:antitoxin (DNA-binding transcriptional repressor) of toxin-antitoxin stability system